MKAGANYIVISKLDVNVEEVKKIIFTFVGEKTVQKIYPDEVEYNGECFLINLFQEDTKKLVGSVLCEAQINFKNKSVAKTAITRMYISETLGTEIVDGNTPSGTSLKEIEIKIVDNVVIAKMDGDISKEDIENAVNDYFYDHHIPSGITTEECEEIVSQYVEKVLDDVDTSAYAKEEMEKVLDKLMTYSNLNNPIVIGFNTDQHLHTDSENSVKIEKDVLTGLRMLRELTNRYPFNIVVLGGDASSSTSSEEVVQSEVMKVTSALKGCDAPLFHLVGNHDGRQNVPTINGGAVIKSHLTEHYKYGVVEQEDINCYYDDKTANVRFIMIRTEKMIGYTTDSSKEFLKKALESTPNDYEIVVFSHRVLGNMNDDKSTRSDWNEPMLWGDVLAPYKDKIICCICGHVHNNISETIDGILYIATTCAGRYELNDGSTRPFGTVDATAYDVFVIDRDTTTIHAIRYGNGDDREFKYNREIPKRGNIIDGIGWTDDKRLNSSGTLTDAVGYSTTDFIENVNSGDILYFADGTLPISKDFVTAYMDDGVTSYQTVPISYEEYGTTYAHNNMYVSLRSDADENIHAYNWKGILECKNAELSSNHGYVMGDFEYYETGYVKSCRIDYANRYKSQGIKFTFPTSKKSSIDIRVNEPFE